MRDRLLMHEVWERLGYDVDRWVAWSLETPFMSGFRQLLFSKIVPNLRRLGLLTPRVRAAFEKIGVLHFETLPDSTQDEAVTMPAELAGVPRRHDRDGGERVAGGLARRAGRAHVAGTSGSVSSGSSAAAGRPTM